MDEDRGVLVGTGFERERERERGAREGGGQAVAMSAMSAMSKLKCMGPCTRELEKATWQVKAAGGRVKRIIVCVWSQHGK